MTMAAFQMAPPPAGHSRMARVAAFHSMKDAEPHWRKLLSSSPLVTPYQSFELLDAWLSSIGKSEGVSPLVVVAFDADDHPLAVLPLAVSRENGARVARFIGGKHTTFNMPIWDRAFASTATSADVSAILDAVSQDGVDVAALTQQPASWGGIANPLAALASHPSTNRCPMMTMPRGGKPEDRITTATRRRLRNKERKLQALPGYRYVIASTDDEITRLLDLFFVVKPLRMALSKLPNIFTDESVKTFVRNACLARLPNGERAVKIHALECDEEMISIFACVTDGERFSTMFNTYTVSENARYSPGLALLRSMIDQYAEQGYTSFDFGIGFDEYKTVFCKQDAPLVDSYVSFTARGRLAAFGMTSLTHAKRLVKQNPAILQMAQMLRNALNR